ncbi:MULTISPECIES: hypothetical protein [Aquimarina]|nr:MULTISPECIES: hypothetical protein [Aquimarina]
MLENLLKLENIQVLEKREQLFTIKGGGDGARLCHGIVGTSTCHDDK